MMKNKAGLTNGRVNFSENQINQSCMEMAMRGLHGHTIAKATGLSVAQIYYRDHLPGFKMRDYRDGKGPIGVPLFTKYSITDGKMNHLTISERKQIMEKYRNGVKDGNR